jgi:protein gp37
MFPFVTVPDWNPVGGRCRHDCYNGKCWASILKRTYRMAKYAGEEPYIAEKELKRKFSRGDFVFVEDMNDLLGSWVPIDMILRVLNYTDHFPDTNFLFLSKNPKRYLEIIASGCTFKNNHILGATVETNRDMEDLSKAPSQPERLECLNKLNAFARGKLFVSVEPIVDFDLNIFAEQLIKLTPWAAAVGYNNYDSANFHLPEPTLEKTQRLILLLENAGITVYRKTLRKAWQEQ